MNVSGGSQLDTDDDHGCVMSSEHFQRDVLLSISINGEISEGMRGNAEPPLIASQKPRTAFDALIAKTRRLHLASQFAQIQQIRHLHGNMFCKNKKSQPTICPKHWYLPDPTQYAREDLTSVSNCQKTPRSSKEMKVVTHNHYPIPYAHKNIREVATGLTVLLIRHLAIV